MEKSNVSNGIVKNYFSYHINYQLYCHVKLKNKIKSAHHRIHLINNSKIPKKLLSLSLSSSVISIATKYHKEKNIAGTFYSIIAFEEI